MNVTESLASDTADAAPAIPVPPPVHDSTASSSHVEGTSDLSVDNSWEKVRVIDEYSDEEYTELDRLFKETTDPLPCVEYWSKEKFDYHGYLMDEERIIGLRVSALPLDLCCFLILI